MNIRSQLLCKPDRRQTNQDKYITSPEHILARVNPDAVDKKPSLTNTNILIAY